MENREREISIGKLLWKLVFCWRFLLIWGVVFAILVTVLFYLKDWKGYKKVENNQAVQVEDLETKFEFTEEQQEQIQNARELIQLIKENETYAQESVLMNIDPYEENVLELRYYVDSDYRFNYLEDISPNYTSAVVASYSEYVQSGEMAENLSQDLDLNCEQKYIQELITVDESSSPEVFSIEIVYSEQETLRDMAEIVKEALNAQTAEISENIGGHTLKLLSENISVKVDLDLASQKKEHANTLTSYRTQLNTQKSTMTEEQLEILGFEASAGEAEEEAEPQTVSVISKPMIRLQYIILGFLAGIFLASVWVVVRVVYAETLQDSEELSELYGIRLFGVLKAPGEVRGLDNKLLKWKNRHKKQMTLEQSLDIISSNIELVCENCNMKQIYLTGTEIENVDKNLLKSIMSNVTKSGIEVVYGENICYDASALRKLAEIGNAVIVEQVELSKYQEIRKELTVIKEQNIKILGGIGINTIKM